MKTLIKPGRVCLLAALMTLGLATAQAQTTANWIGPATGGEWNTGANWDTGFPPLDATTNAVIGAGTNVSYNLPMTAAGFGDLTNNGEVNVNAPGFNCTDIIMIQPTVAKIFLITNSTAVVNVSGNFTMGTNCSATLVPGATLTVGGSLVVAASESTSANNTSTFTNSGGTLTASSTAVNNNGGTGTGLLVIKGGVNNLGNTVVGRYHGTSASTLGTEGLSISGGVVTMTNLNLGNNGVGASFLTGFMSGGTVTNYGSLYINNLTSGRYSRFVQTGGFFTTPDPGVVNPNSTTAGNVTAIYSVTGGTNVVGGFYFGNSNTLVAALTFFTNSAVIYVGSQGISTNGSATNVIALNNNGMFGATADWIGAADMILNGGTFNFQAADVDGTPHNITVNGSLRGSGGLNKTGAGMLTLTTSNGFSGATFIQNGTLALGTNEATATSGSLAGSSIIVGSGATLNVSAAAPYPINSLQILGGSGTVIGAVAVSPSGVINPGSNSVTGTLAINGDVIETNGAVNHFDVPGDVLNITGTLNVSGANTIEVAGGLPPGTPYALIHYGTLNGDVSNFALTGATGVLSNSVTDKTIYLTIASSLRGNTNLTWVGNSVTNDWDTHNLTNWVDGGSSTLDFFLAGDIARFDNTGGANTNVNIPGSVAPSAAIVDSTLNYTFSGAGSIAGPATTLTKTNSGTLTILTTNSYGGPTTFGGGVVEIFSITNSTFPSPLGAGIDDPSLLVFNGGALRYSGDTGSTDHGATLNTNAIVDVTNSATTLTINGTVTGTGGLAKVGQGTLSLTGVNSYVGPTSLTNGVLSVATATSISANTINYAGGTLNLASASAQQFYANLNNVITNSTIIQNGGNANLILSGGWTGSNVINFSLASGGTLTLNNDITTNFTGIMRMTDTSVGGFRFNSGGSATSAQQCNGSPLVVFDLGNGSASLFNRNGGGLSFGFYNLGALTGGPSTILKGNGSGSTATINSSFYSIGALNLDTTFAGTIADGNTATAVIKVGTGRLTLTGSSSYTGMTVVSNGVIALGDGVTDGTLGGTTNINISAGAFLDVSKRSDGTLTLQGSQVLLGNGTVLGSVVNTGFISPGGGIGGAVGTLTITNAVSGSGISWMKLDRSSVPNSDRLVSPNISIDGSTLVVTNAGAPLHAGDTFTLFNGLVTGSFQTVALPNYYTWNTNQLAVNGTLSVVSFNPPSLHVDFSTFSTGSITFNASNGIPNGPLSVLSSTNLALPVAQWTVVTTGNFDGSGNFSTAVAVDPSTAPTQFFLLSAQ